MRKLLFVLCTLQKQLFHCKGLKLNGFQKMQFSTQISIKDKGSIILGKRTSTDKRVALLVKGGVIEVGDYVFFNRNCIIASQNHICIGNRCIFGPNVTIYDHDHKFNYEGVMNDEYNRSPVIIEDNCWVGANVTILRGTHIGEGCVIGAGAIVKGEIPAHSLVVTNRELIIKPIVK